jgi:hypothetical protein
MTEELKYIYRIGVELEGGWESEKRGMEADGSLEDLGSKYIGEICSNPLTLDKLLPWIERHYPDEVNWSCGFHIHFSLKHNAYYANLLSPKFYDYFLDEVCKWGEKMKIRNSEFRKRLNGENGFCKRVFCPDEQIHLRYKEIKRYAHLNYCYSLHRTIECRLFPMFIESRVAIWAVKELVRIVESWLDDHPVNENPLTIEVDTPDTEPTIMNLEDEVAEEDVKIVIEDEVEDKEATCAL